MSMQWFNPHDWCILESRSLMIFGGNDSIWNISQDQVGIVGLFVWMMWQLSHTALSISAWWKWFPILSTVAILPYQYVHVAMHASCLQTLSDVIFQTLFWTILTCLQTLFPMPQGMLATCCYDACLRSEDRTRGVYSTEAFSHQRHRAYDLQGTDGNNAPEIIT